MHNGTHITSERRGRKKMGSGFKRPQSVADIFPRQQSVKITISRSGTDNSAEKVDVSLPSPFSATLHVNEAKNSAFFLLGSRRPAAILHWAPFQEITVFSLFLFLLLHLIEGRWRGFPCPTVPHLKAQVALSPLSLVLCCSKLYAIVEEMSESRGGGLSFPLWTRPVIVDSMAPITGQLYTCLVWANSPASNESLIALMKLVKGLCATESISAAAKRPRISGRSG